MSNRFLPGLWRTSLWAMPIAVMFSFALAVPHANATTHKANTQKSQSSTDWSKKAEEDFFLSPGMGHKLMSKEEWQMHWKKMQNMKPDERMAYRDQWHKKFMQEAREKGMDIPSVPPGHGKKGHMEKAALLLINATGEGNRIMGNDRTSDSRFIAFLSNKSKDGSTQDKDRSSTKSDMDKDRGNFGSDRDMDRGFQTDRNFHTDQDFGMGMDMGRGDTQRSDFSMTYGTGNDTGKSGPKRSTLMWYHTNKRHNDHGTIVFVDSEHKESWSEHRESWGDNDRPHFHGERHEYEFDRDPGAWGNDAGIGISGDVDRDRGFYPYGPREDRGPDIGIELHGEVR